MAQPEQNNEHDLLKSIMNFITAELKAQGKEKIEYILSELEKEMNENLEQMVAGYVLNVHKHMSITQSAERMIIEIKSNLDKYEKTSN